MPEDEMILSDKLNSIPPKPGVYMFSDKHKKILYVGKAKVLRTRVRSYFQKSRPQDPRLSIMIKKIEDLQFIITDSEVEALILEANLIKEYKPKYNINLKDDKSYPYIRITAEDFPQVFPTRRLIRDGSTYFGPYTNVTDMRNALTTLKQISSIRSCKFDLNPEAINKKKVNLCLEYYIKKCKGPCQSLQSREDYMAMIERVQQFLKGKTSHLQQELTNEMQQLAEKQEFEDAARIRDKIEVLNKYRNNQKIVMSDLRDRDIIALATEDDDACAVIFKIREGKVINRVHYYLSSVFQKDIADVLSHFINQYYTQTEELPQEILLMEKINQKEVTENWLGSRANKTVKILIPKTGEKKKLVDLCKKNARYLLEELKLQKMKAKDYIPHSLKSLQRDLRLSSAPKRIECFDISNIQGSDAVASMVCFVNGRPKKSEYRKYSIKTKSSPDDFAMIREVIQRRYSRLLKENVPFPDLIVVDGGKGQLTSALYVLKALGVNSQPIIGLAKRLEEIFVPNISDAQMLPRTSSSLKILQQIRDEAHRFALTYHRKKRKKRTLVSSLDQIPGIGPKWRTKLLIKFGSIKNISNCGIDMLIKEGKVSKKVAKAIYNHFHPEENKSE